MTKTRLILIGGFLGAGKTTLMLRAADQLARQGLRVGMVTNDQGQDLVDTALVHQHAIPVQEVAGGCFCCRFPNFVESVRQIKQTTQPDVILAEPVGSCTDLMATVVRPIREYHADEFEIAPLTVLLDPQRDLEHFPSTVNYLYDRQATEAEIIALSKCDVLDADARRDKLRELEAAYPEARIVALSARTGAGVAEWIEQALTQSSSASQAMDVDYAMYAEAEASLGWLNTKIDLRGSPHLSPAAWITQTLDSLNQTFSQGNMSVAHLKLHLNAPGASFKAGFTRSGEPTIWDLRGDSDVTDQAQVILNARVNTTPDRLRTAVQQAIHDVSTRLQIQFEYRHLECFSPLPPQPTYRLL